MLIPTSSTKEPLSANSVTCTDSNQQTLYTAVKTEGTHTLRKRAGN